VGGAFQGKRMRWMAHWMVLDKDEMRKCTPDKVKKIFLDFLNPGG
jgi:hypothetical protein